MKRILSTYDDSGVPVSVSIEDLRAHNSILKMRIAELENVIKVINKTAHNDKDAEECLGEIYEAVLKLSDKGQIK